MRLSLASVVLWAAGFAANVALVLVLAHKRRFRVVPWFTAWMGWEMLYTLSCFLAFRLVSGEAYTVVYWAGGFIELTLQIAVVAEIALLIMKPHGCWIEGARTAVLPFVVTGPVIASLLAGFMKPAAGSAVNEFAARANLFSTIVVCFLFVSIVRASQRLALDWRSYIARESLGLTMWTITAFVTDTLHAYWRTMRHFQELENLRVFAFLLALLYWCVVFWLPEPASPRMPATPLRDYTERLGD